MNFIGFNLIYVDLGRFHRFQGQKSCSLCQPVPALRAGLLPLKEDGRLQSCRFGGLDAWMPGGLEAGGLDPGALEAGWLVFWLTGLDWIGFAWLLDRK